MSDLLKNSLAEWIAALDTAFDAANFTTSYHPTNNGYRLGELTVRLKTQPDQMYKITFLSKAERVGQQRVGYVCVNLYNPLGKVTVNMKGFSPEKVTKIVNYAKVFIQDRVAYEARIDAVRTRKIAAREQWNAANVTLPDWMGANPNTDTDADVGTFHAFFYEHRVNYGLKRLTIGQVKRLAAFVTTLAAEPSIEEVEADLAAKLLQRGQGSDQVRPES